jgi:hypothetical protein
MAAKRRKKRKKLFGASYHVDSRVLWLGRLLLFIKYLYSFCASCALLRPIILIAAYEEIELLLRRIGTLSPYLFEFD